jgi:hypothetical protein
MSALPRRVWSSSLLAVLSACGGAAQHAQPSVQPAQLCSGAQTVEHSDTKRAGSVFGRLAQPLVAPLVFACPSGAPCTLPPDKTVSLRVNFDERFACEFAACRVPYAFATLPFEHSDRDPCPPVMWSTATVELHTDGGTVDLQGEKGASHVNVLARREGDGYLRFIVESPSSMQRWLATDQPRAVLLDIQVELTRDRVRGQMSALAAPLPSEPAAELRFTSLWTATWEAGGTEATQAPLSVQ